MRLEQFSITNIIHNLISYLHLPVVEDVDDALMISKRAKNFKLHFTLRQQSYFKNEYLFIYPVLCFKMLTRAELSLDMFLRVLFSYSDQRTFIILIYNGQN